MAKLKNVWLDFKTVTKSEAGSRVQLNKIRTHNNFTIYKIFNKRTKRYNPLERKIRWIQFLRFKAISIRRRDTITTTVLDLFNFVCQTNTCNN